MSLSLSEFRLAVRVGAWLCLLPIILRVRRLPILLEQLAVSGGRRGSKSPLELNRVVQIVWRVSRMRLFRVPVFPRLCLRQSLALYYVLTRMGYPVEIHFGVRKDEQDLRGHSWVTLQGEILGERTPAEGFRTIYSYPTADHQILREISDLRKRQAV